MTTVDLSISLASELRSLSVKGLELKSTRDELAETKKIMADKVRIMTETTTENEYLNKKVESGK